MTVAEPATEPELEQGQLFLQRTAARRQHDARAEMHGANALLFGGGRRRLPLLADVAQEVIARPRQLIQSFVAPIAVPADRRTAEEDRRLVIQRSHRRGEQ